MTSVSESYSPPANGFRTFLVVWATQSISVFGSALTLFALNIWLVQTLYPNPEQKPQLALALSALNLAFAIPTLILAPVAGAWADRHDRKRTMMAADAFNGVISMLYMTFAFTGHLSLPVMLGMIAVSASLGAFHGSSFDTSYVMLVPENQLPRANGMMQTIWSLSGILSPALAAGIISLPALARQGWMPGFMAGFLSPMSNGTPLAMFIDGLTFFGASLTLVFLTIPSPKRTDLQISAERGKKSIWSDMKDGALYIWHRRPMLWLLGTFAMANFLSGPLGVFTPLLVKFNIAGDWTARGFSYETTLATLNTIAAVGGVAGGLFISAWGGLKKRRVYGVVFAILAAGLSQVLLGLSPWLFLSAGAFFLLDFLIPVMNSHSTAIWQTQVPREMQGRVFAVRRVIAQFTWPISTALAGWLGGSLNPGYVVAVMGGILVVFCIGQLFNPYLLRVEDKEFLEQLAAQAA